MTDIRFCLKSLIKISNSWLYADHSFHHAYPDLQIVIDSSCFLVRLSENYHHLHDAKTLYHLDHLGAASSIISCDIDECLFPF